MVENARRIAREFKLEIEVIDEKEAKRRGMNAFAGISQGSHQPSFMLVLKYIVDKKKPIFGVDSLEDGDEVVKLARVAKVDGMPDFRSEKPL